MLRALIPFLIFVGLVALLYGGLGRDPKYVPSPLVNKAAPELNLPSLGDAQKLIKINDLRGKVTLINIWASWCAECRHEHPMLLELAKQNIVPILGFNYKDTRDAAQQWLNQFGNPYYDVVVDEEGRVGINWGVYGVPETFVIDQQGMIRYKHVGPLTPEAMEKTVLPLVRELELAAGR